MTPRWGRALAAIALVATVAAACTSGEPEPDEPTAQPTDASPEPAPSPSPTETPSCDLADDADCSDWAVPAGDPIAANPSLLVVTTDEGQVAIDPDSGETGWTVAAATGEQVVLEVTPAGVLRATVDAENVATTELLDLATGEVVWTTAGFFLQSPIDGVLGLHEDGGTLRVLDLASGEELWATEGVSTFGFYADGTEALVVRTDGTALVDVRTGEQRWVVADTGQPFPGNLALGPTVAHVPGPAGRLVVDRETGEQVGAPDAEGRTTIIGDLLAVNVDTTARLLAPDGSERASLPGLVLTDRDASVVLLGTEQEGQEAIARLDPATGDVLWQVRGGLDDIQQVVASTDLLALVRPGRISVHDLATGDELLDVRGPEGSVISVEPLLVLTGGSVHHVTLP